MRRIVLAVLVVILGGAVDRGISSTENVELLGAGATFPYPLYSKMFSEYYKEYGVKVNYQSIGSGGGIRQLMNRTVDFGASDAFMSDEELERAPAHIVHIPICLGAVVLTYNIPGNPELRLTPDLLADIYLGKVTKWNDPRIIELNPSEDIPDANIVVVHRSDGSGTTYLFTEYLSKVNQEWQERVGKGKSVNWPSGLGAKGNAGVLGLIKQIEGSIGYVELAYALQNKMPCALLKNRSGEFVRPSLESISLSAEKEIPPDTRISLTNSDAPGGYPISGFTWILVYREQNYKSRKKEKAKALFELLWWMTHEGQVYATPLHYAPLPSTAQKRAEEIIRSITYGGKRLIM